ncbi:MAG: protein phosphatase [SAR202 cluster bacterium]|nr:protein phosphatase [SAR202 cluster bacterium]
MINKEALPLGFSWIAPGLVGGSRGPRSGRDLALLRGAGVQALVRLEPGALAASLHGEAEALGLDDLHEPVQDFTPPSLEQLERIVDFIEARLKEGKSVGVSCTFGLGRTGTALACWLVSTGLEAEVAINRVRRLRPGSIEVEGQEEAVRAYEVWRRGRIGKAE